MKNRNLRVTIDVAGTAGSGKSVISYIIEQALKKYGFDVNHDYIEPDNESETQKWDEERVIQQSKAIQNSSDIQINLKEYQLTRRITENGLKTSKRNINV